MDTNIPYTTKNKPLSLDLKHDPSVSPVWAKLLFKGVEKRDKLQKGIDELRSDPSMIFKGLLGKSLLDRHIDPFFKNLLPDSTKVDVLKQQLKFKPSKNFDMTLGKRGDTAKLGFNWRF